MTWHCCGNMPGAIPRKRLPRSSRGTSIWFIPSPCARCATRSGGRNHTGGFHHFGTQGKSLRDQNILSGWLCRTARYGGAICADNSTPAATTRTGGFHAIHLERTAEAETWTANRAGCWTAPWPSLGQKIATRSCCGFLKTKLCRKSARVGRERRRGANAREPRDGKAAEIFHETRHRVFRGDHCRGDFRQFRSSRAGGAGKIRDCRGDCQRCDGRGSTLTLIKGALKIMAWTKAKDSNCGWRRNLARCWNNDTACRKTH